MVDLQKDKRLNVIIDQFVQFMPIRSGRGSGPLYISVEGLTVVNQVAKTRDEEHQRRDNSPKRIIESHNKFSMISVEADVGIKTMDFSRNLLRDLEDITKIQTLQNLYLSENPLSPLQISTFTFLDDLQTLHLRSTGISLDDNYFTTQKKLTFLDISANGLTSLDLRNLKSLTSLQTLYLHENNLTKLENVEDIKTILPSLSTITLFKNNFGCFYNILMHELL
uniref:Uncharacterized protein n=1 Tax=Lutzomyia longipalpis TaxID=7200 RepID=A0A1B0CDP1_LUTLO